MSCFVFGMMAASIGVSQRAEAQAFITLAYDGDDFSSYYLDPPYWSYQPKGFCSRKNARTGSTKIIDTCSSTSN
jgi:hypothetical protein